MKLLNDLKNMVIKVAVVVKDAARRAWHSAVALVRRLRQTTVKQVTAFQTVAANWWPATRTFITTFVVVYVLMALLAVSSMTYAFYLERAIPEIKTWLDALFAGHLHLPGWHIIAARVGHFPEAVTPDLVGISTAAAG